MVWQIPKDILVTRNMGCWKISTDVDNMIQMNFYRHSLVVYVVEESKLLQFQVIHYHGLNLYLVLKMISLINHSIQLLTLENLCLIWLIVLRKCYSLKESIGIGAVHSIKMFHSVNNLYLHYLIVVLVLLIHSINIYPMQS